MRGGRIRLEMRKMRPGGGRFAVKVAGCSGHEGYVGLLGLMAAFPDPYQRA